MARFNSITIFAHIFIPPSAASTCRGSAGPRQKKVAYFPSKTRNKYNEANVHYYLRKQVSWSSQDHYFTIEVNLGTIDTSHHLLSFSSLRNPYWAYGTYRLLSLCLITVLITIICVPTRQTTILLPVRK